MKKDKENHPLDDLFARKLGNLSLPPSTDGFERLQARLNQRDQQPKLVVWRNPVVQRYMAIAACLLLVCLFGWLYWPTTSQNDSPVAIDHTSRSARNKNNSLENAPKEALAKVDKSSSQSSQKINPTKTTATTALKLTETYSNDAHLAQLETKTRLAKHVVLPTIGNAPEGKTALAQIPSVDNNTSIGQPTAINATMPPAAEQLANNAIKANTPTERVLVVTIEEPAVLVAARQEKNSATEKVVQTSDEKDLKEMKGNGLWQQVKRLKQGELFARSENAANDDQGLLSRAYSGLKQSFDKGKSTKQ